MCPLVEIWKIDLSGSIHMLTYFHLHIRGRLDVAERCMIGVCVEEVQRDWDVVVLTPIGHRDRTLNIDEVSLLSIVECELVLLRAESLVVVDQV